MLDLLCGYVPLGLVFLSGIGFSLQTLVIKVLQEGGFHASFQCVFCRGVVQFIISGCFVLMNKERKLGKGPKLFGDTNYIRLIMFLRSFIGFGGISFSFLAVERLPLGDATVLVMLSPLIASIGGFLILGEPWRLPEFVATIISLSGAALVARPSFLFGSSGGHGADIIGVVFALCGSLSAGISYVCVRMLGTSCKMPWSYVCFSQAIAQMIMAVPSLYIAGQTVDFSLTLRQTGLVFLGGFIGAWSQIFMTIGMQREKSASGAAMRMSDVLFGFVWQALFTSDVISHLSLLGATLITSSILIIVFFKSKTTSEPAHVASKLQADTGLATNDGIELSDIHNASEANTPSDISKKTLSIQSILSRRLRLAAAGLTSSWRSGPKSAAASYERVSQRDEECEGEDTPVHSDSIK